MADSLQDDIGENPERSPSGVIAEGKLIEDFASLLNEQAHLLAKTRESTEKTESDYKHAYRIIVHAPQLKKKWTRKKVFSKLCVGFGLAAIINATTNQYMQTNLAITHCLVGAISAICGWWLEED